jgi:hypothetical protein
MAPKKATPALEKCGRCFKKHAPIRGQVFGIITGGSGKKQLLIIQLRILVKISLMTKT